MAETIDELTMQYEEDGEILVKEVDKNVLTRGSWTTICYLYQDLNKNTKEFGPLKVSVRRYQKRSGSFRQQSKFNISSKKQALAIVDVLQGWFPEEEEAGNEQD